MKITKKVLSFLFIVTLLVSITGCRTKEAPPAVDKTERKIVIYGMDDSNDVMEKLISEYTTKKTNVTAVYVRFSNFEEYEKTLLNQMAEGEGPDIFAMPNSWFVKNKKKLVPMPASQGTVGAVRSTFVDVVGKDMITTDKDGIERVYGIPLYVDTLGIFYNKDQFEDKLPTSGKPALLWDGIKNNVFALTKVDPADPTKFEVAGIGLGLGASVTYAPDILSAMMLQQGVPFYDALMSKSTLMSYGDAGVSPAINAMDLFTGFADPAQKIYSFNKFVGEGMKYPDIDAFVMGKTSMIFGYAGTYNLILSERNNLKSKGVNVIDEAAIKTAFFPQKIDPTTSTEKRVTYANYYSFGVSRNSKNQETAWDLVTTLASPEIEKEYFQLTNKPTSRRDLIPVERMDPIFGPFVDQVGFAESYPVVDYLKNKDLIRGAIESVNSGVDSMKALKILQEQIQSMLPAAGYIVPLNEEYYKNQAANK